MLSTLQKYQMYINAFKTSNTKNKSRKIVISYGHLAKRSVQRDSVYKPGKPENKNHVYVMARRIFRQKQMTKLNAKKKARLLRLLF